MTVQFFCLILSLNLLAILQTAENQETSKGSKSPPLWDVPAKMMNSIWEKMVEPTYRSVYGEIYRQEMMRALKEAGINTSELGEKELKMIEKYEQMNITQSWNTYSCADHKVGSPFAFMVVGGTGSKAFYSRYHESAYSILPRDPADRLMESALKKSACKGAMRFDYDDRESLQTIYHSFEKALFDLSERSATRRLLILGLSAGGNLLAFAASRIPQSYSIEIHTMASPLNGYGLNRFGELMINQFAPSDSYPPQSFYRHIGLGFDSYLQAKDHIRVFHHKEGESASHLVSHCGRFAGYCDPLKIQSNNVPNAQEFYYEGDLNIPVVFQNILTCQ